MPICGTCHGGGKLRTVGSYVVREFFPHREKMATNKGTKLKVPNGPADISAIEDALAEVAEDLRAIRRKMAEKDMPAVELMTGTFSFYLTEMRQIAKGWMSDLDKQLIARQANDVRRRKAQQLADRNKKR
jgi:hypothetical protein